mgnify:CR=1 FL=1
MVIGRTILIVLSGFIEELLGSQVFLESVKLSFTLWGAMSLEGKVGFLVVLSLLLELTSGISLVFSY